MTFELSKNERLHSKKLIKELFDKGSSFFLYPFKVLVIDVPVEVSENNQVLFSVSKRKFKKAVDRNLVKRRMREAYRLHKRDIHTQDGHKKLIAFIYVSADIITFQAIEGKLSKILANISKST